MINCSSVFILAQMM